MSVMGYFASRALRARPSVTFYHLEAWSILASSMIPLSQSEAHSRSPRMNLVSSTTAVLRFQSGVQLRGKLQVISLTGGLLCLPSLLNQHSAVRLMFRAETGLVLGTAEMLVPISSNQQPFRFVAIDEDDRRRLNDAIQSSVDKTRLGQQSIVRDRVW